MSNKRGLLERLDAGEVVIGDGGFVFALEKRGYVKAGPWTPEACVEHPEAVKQLHREFLRAGSDVMQAFTFYASDDKLSNRGNKAGSYGCAEINKAACRIAREVASEGGALVLGGVCQTPSYLSGLGKAVVQAEFKKQSDAFVELGVDFLLAEYFEHIEEMEWAIEVLKATGLPVASSMCIGPEGDLHGVSTATCGVRMAQAGSDVVGINCHFDPDVALAAVAEMKKGLDAAGIKKHLIVQPLGFKTPDVNTQGFIDLPEFPFALEPRICTRWDMHKYARDAYELGVRYIGGCCGFEPYHIRALSEELSKERGKLPEGTEKHAMWGGGLLMHTKPWVRQRAKKEYWQNIKPASGRPFCPSMSKPDAWGVTAGHKHLAQKKEETTENELKAESKELVGH
ncbi:betaine--homocysteine S-methyltransferase 1-like [Rhopilema esculentum]|uniref:betaine--homocysteine S-methyltransferase 1-like n=1 Tax=Rhopilema esculentum TaxID=499914 RepID=UPI0031D8C0BA